MNIAGEWDQREVVTYRRPEHSAQEWTGLDDSMEFQLSPGYTRLHPDLILWLQSNFNKRNEPFQISLVEIIHATTLLSEKLLTPKERNQIF